MTANRASLKKQYSLEEYYQFQDEISTKGLIVDGQDISRVEYNKGEIVFMAGGTLKHSALTANLMTEIGPLLKGTKCRPYDGNANLAIDSIKAILHPDLFIVCDGIKKSAFDKNGITNAKVIIEVLSKSTALYDRTGKFRKYKQIPEFEEYILVNQDKALVESFVKHENNLWHLKEYEGVEQHFAIDSLDLTISMEATYKDVDEGQFRSKFGVFKTHQSVH